MGNFCTNCGKEIEKNAKFCPYCGKKTINKDNKNNSQTTNQDKSTVQNPNKEFTDIFVKGEAQSIRQTVQNIFNHNNFKIEWQTQFSGIAKRGSKGANFALGCLAQYYEINFSIYQTQNEDIAIRLIRSNIGMLGGAIGAHKVGKQFSEVVNMLSNTFYQMGIYKGRNPQ